MNVFKYVVEVCACRYVTRRRRTRTLVVSRTCSSFGDRTFAAAGPGPQVWNSLPPNLRLCGLSYGQFMRLVKTCLFGQ